MRSAYSGWDQDGDRSRSKTVEVDDLELRNETDKAWLVRSERGGRKEAWLPKSLAEYDEKTKVFTMPEWLAMREGLI